LPEKWSESGGRQQVLAVDCGWWWLLVAVNAWTGGSECLDLELG